MDHAEVARCVLEPINTVFAQLNEAVCEPDKSQETRSHGYRIGHFVIDIGNPGPLTSAEGRVERKRERATWALLVAARKPCATIAQWPIGRGYDHGRAHDMPCKTPRKQVAEPIQNIQIAPAIWMLAHVFFFRCGKLSGEDEQSNLVGTIVGQRVKQLGY